jgi:hypothetical protein
MTLTMIQQCSTCEEILPLSAFEWRWERNRHYRQCRYCRAAVKRLHRSKYRGAIGKWTNLIESCKESASDLNPNTPNAQTTLGG